MYILYLFCTDEAATPSLHYGYSTYMVLSERPVSYKQSEMVCKLELGHNATVWRPESHGEFIAIISRLILTSQSTMILYSALTIGAGVC